MAYLNKTDPGTSNWIADYKKIGLLSSSEQLCKLKTFRKDELTEGVEMEYTKPQAACGQGLLLREAFTFSFGLEWKRDLIPHEGGRNMMLPHPPPWELFFIVRSFSEEEVATFLQENKAKDGAVLIFPGSELRIYSPGLADPGVEIMCPKAFVLRDPQGSPPGWRMTLRWWFGPVLYVNCITSTNENTLRLRWVDVYTRRLNCESVQLGLIKIKYHHINHEQRHAKEILRQCSSGALQMPRCSWSAKSFLPPKEHPNAFTIDQEIKKAQTTKRKAWILLLYWIAINMAAVGDVAGKEA